MRLQFSLWRILGLVLERVFYVAARVGLAEVVSRLRQVVLGSLRQLSDCLGGPLRAFTCVDRGSVYFLVSVGVHVVKLQIKLVN